MADRDKQGRNQPAYVNCHNALRVAGAGASQQSGKLEKYSRDAEESGQVRGGRGDAPAGAGVEREGAGPGAPFHADEHEQLRGGA